MYTRAAENIYTIHVPLPNNPLQYLNAYLIAGNDRNLLIDTGFRSSPCREALQEGLDELGISMNNTDIFLTHLHSDHTGLAPEFASPSTRVFISHEDHVRMDKASSGTSWYSSDAFFSAEGFPREELNELELINPARLYSPPPFDNYTDIGEGQVLRYGGYELTTISTPGHTPGHMCLYIASEKIMFLGDHVLFDITPNVTAWQGFPNSLGRYLDSLRSIAKYEVILPLPGHRKAEFDMRTRISQLLSHHEDRLAETLSIIRECNGRNAYEIAGAMTWKIRSRNWAEFPLAQKWFAVGEAISHLDALIDEGKIRKERIDSVYRYYAL